MSLLTPLTLPFSLLFTLPRPILVTRWIPIGSLIGCLGAMFLLVIAVQSPCPWWVDTFLGAFVVVTIEFLSNVIIAYVRVAIGNQIQVQCSNRKGLFDFGVSGQLGLALGTIPAYLLVDFFSVFIARQPCEVYRGRKSIGSMSSGMSLNAKAHWFESRVCVVRSTQ
jgi:hypothetical protein